MLHFGDLQTSSDIARWIVGQIETHPHFDTVLDGVFITEAWLKLVVFSVNVSEQKNSPLQLMLQLIMDKNNNLKLIQLIWMLHKNSLYITS